MYTLRKALMTTVTAAALLAATVLTPVAAHAACTKEQVGGTGVEFAWVRGQPSLDSKQLWKVTKDMVVTYCGRHKTDNRGITWHWITFRSAEEPWDHNGWMSENVLVAYAQHPYQGREPKQEPQPHMRITRCVGAGSWKDCAYIVISGPITSDDGSEFLLRTKEIATAVVFLNSGGGNMLSALQIGERVHEAGYVTVVPNNALCVSGCAMIWLAGTNRSLGNNAALVWHVPSREDDPSHADGTASAINGMYLAKLGYGYDTVLKLFGHDPAALYAIAKDSQGQVTEGNFTVPSS